MTSDELGKFLAALPPETLAQLRQMADFAARATRARQKLREHFPRMNPRLAAALSLLIARLT